MSETLTTDMLAKFDDRKYVFRLGDFHGEPVLMRAERTGRKSHDEETRYPFCAEHKSWSCGIYRVVTGIEAARWALERRAAPQQPMSEESGER